MILEPYFLISCPMARKNRLDLSLERYLLWRRIAPIWIRKFWPACIVFNVSIYSYLFGRHFKLSLDRSQTARNTFQQTGVYPPQASSRIQCWVLKLAAYDNRMKWLEVIPMKSLTALTTVQRLRILFSHFECQS